MASLFILWYRIFVYTDRLMDKGQAKGLAL